MMLPYETVENTICVLMECRAFFQRAKVCEDWLDDRNPSGVDLPPLLALDFPHHQIGEVDSIRFERDHQGLRTTAIAVDVPAFHRAAHAVLLLCFVHPVRGDVCSAASSCMRGLFPFGQIYLFSFSS